MKYTSFEQLPVWRDAVRLAAEAFRLTMHPVFRGKGDLANQFQRAALSVSNNIAEGFERQTVRELLQFVYFAKGSAGECISMCAVMRELAFLNDHLDAVGRVEALCQSIARQLGAWAASQRDGGVQGTRYLNTEAKHRREVTDRGRAFIEKLRRDHEERLRALSRERRGDSE